MTLALALGACSSDGGSGPAPSVPSEAGGGGPAGVPDTDVDIVTGAERPAESSPETPADIARYGVVAVGDENGVSSGDALASFSRLSTAVSLEAFGAALLLSADPCTIGDDDGRPDLTLVSALYLPVPDGAGLTSIGAGDAVLLSSADGSWSELQGRPSDRFYTRPSSAAPPTGLVPDGLVANVTGDDFPAFVDAAFADVTPLDGVDYTGGPDIAADTRFTWRPSGDPDARLRIETTSVASFFDDRGVSLSCVVPDTGEFAFPADVRSTLGTGFIGTAADFSRLAVRDVRDGDALLVLVRESFLVP